MTKVRGRTPETGIAQLEESLRRLRTDHVDLWQFHAIAAPDDPRQIYEDGLLEAALRAREQGKVRYLGFTGHTHPDLHLEMIERGHPWDAVQMPINPFDPHYLSFVLGILPVAVERGIGVIAMKTMGGTPGRLPGTGVVSPQECLRYAMSLPVATVCSGMDSLPVLRANLGTARRFAPYAADELAALVARTATAAAGGRHEGYKARG